MTPLSFHNNYYSSSTAEITFEPKLSSPGGEEEGVYRFLQGMNTQQKERLAISIIKNHNGPALASDMKSLSSTAEISFTPQ
jgi:hypothetical protein